MRIAVLSPDRSATEAVRQLLLPWHVQYTTLEKAEIVIAYKDVAENSRTVVIPSETQQFRQWLAKTNLRYVKVQGESLGISTAKRVTLTFRPQSMYYYVTSRKMDSIDSLLLQVDESTTLLTLDIVREYNLKLAETFRPRISPLYRILTGLPVPYSVAPANIRKLLFKTGRKGHTETSYVDYLSLDATRYLLVAAIQATTNRKLEKKMWNGRRYACLVTHDIDTRDGLRRATRIKRAEERYDIPSTWYIPSHQYKLDREIIKDLLNHGEIGAHDTKHDGKLAQLLETEMLGRLREAREALEEITGQPVEGFRAPLLQHNIKIIRALGKAGYSYDTSIPTWEPKHPRTMKPHGIATTFPMIFDTLVEIPVTMLQDQQVLRVLGLAPAEMVRWWEHVIRTISDLGAVCTMLVHPDYELADDRYGACYEELMNSIAADKNAWIATPACMVTGRDIFQKREQQRGSFSWF